MGKRSPLLGRYYARSGFEGEIVVYGFKAVTVRAEALEVVDATGTATGARGDVVNVEELEVIGIETAVKAVPTDVGGGFFGGAIELNNTPSVVNGE